MADQCQKNIKILEESPINDPVLPEIATLKNIAWSFKEFPGHYYLTVIGNTSWINADKVCRKLGGHLVYFETDIERRLVFEGASSGISCMWTGATDAHQEGDWRWGGSQGTPLSKLVWYKRTVAPKNNSANYGRTYESGGINAINNVDRGIRGFICEWEPQKKKRRR